MDWKNYGIFLYAFFLSSFASVVLNPSSNNVTLCLGETGPCRRTFTCDVTGSLLVWDFTGFSGISFSTSATSTRSLGQNIEVKLLSIYNGVVRSMATVNATSAINGTTLQCRNQLFETGSVNQEVNFYVESTSAVTQIFWDAIDSASNIIILVTWPMATCAAMYNVSVERNGKLRYTQSVLESTFFMFNVKKGDVNDSGIYKIAVNSVDYNGVSFGVPASRNISINTPEFIVSHVINCMDETLSLIIEEEATSVPQLDVMSCVISLANVTYMYNNTMSCIGRKINFDIAIGGSYDYNVTVTNLFDSLSIRGFASTSMCIETTATTQTPESSMITFASSPYISSPPSPTETIMSVSADNTPYIATSIIFGSLFGFLLLFIVFERLRCFCPTASFWSIVFCNCLDKGDKKTMPFDAEEIPNKNMSSDL